MGAIKLPYTQENYYTNYDLDSNKMYQIERVPHLYTLRKHPDALSRELSFRSPFILKYYKIKYGFDTQQVYTVTEKVNGTSLDQLLKYGCPTYDVLKQMIFKILKGFEALHESDVLHRDICLNNIMVEFTFPVFTPKISGFRIFEPKCYHTPMYFSNPGYVAPEVESYGTYDSCSEVWSIGTLIYDILSFKFQAGSIGTSAYDLEVMPEYFRDFLFMALNKDPEQRPKNVKELNSRLYQNLGKRDRLIYDTID